MIPGWKAAAAALLLAACAATPSWETPCESLEAPPRPPLTPPDDTSRLSAVISPNLEQARKAGFHLLASRPPFCVRFQAHVYGAQAEVQYWWDFDGDGQTDSTRPSPPAHAYELPGEFMAGLTVADASGAVARAQQRIVVIGDPTIPDWRYGVNAHLAWFPGVYEDALAANKAAGWISDMGIDVVRGGVDWHTVQPAGGDAFDWARYDFLFGLVTRHEFELLPILAYGAPWSLRPDQSYQGGDRLKHAPATGDFAWFAYQAAARYRTRAVAWEVWNEPNLEIFWPPEPDPAYYAELVKATYPAVKYGDPDAVVVLGALANDISQEAPELAVVPPERFLQTLYDEGAGDSFDVVARNPYAHPQLGGQAIAGMLRAMREVMNRNGDSAKPLWVTETGYASIPAWGVTEAGQASWLAESAQAALGDGGASLFTWYNFRDKGEHPEEFDHNLGLIRRDWGRKPAFETYADLIAQGK